MSKAILKKHLSDNIGRMFNLAFNQIAMYSTYHKSAVAALERFYNFLSDGFKIQDSIALSLNQENIFVEDEALDSRINTSRLAFHLKKTGVQSISFSAGLDLGDAALFFEIFTDLQRYRNADAMKKALEKRQIDKVSINYFVYAKVKSDETVVHSSQVGKEGAGGGGQGAPTAEDILTIMAADILSDELQRNLSIQNFMQNPAELSQMLIDEDIAVARKSSGQGSAAGQGGAPGQGSTPGRGGAGRGAAPGTTLARGLNLLRNEINGALEGRSDVNIADLAENVFELKQQLLRGIEAQKAKGVIYLDENRIRQEADEMTDGVLVKLLTEEYQKGAVSIKRLAQITLRLVSQPAELQRILPKLRRALVAAGMPLVDFLEYVQAVKDELQSDELTSVLERSAEAIGLDGEDLIREIMNRPQDAAELIYLAAEIRRSGEDKSALADLMADYIDRAGSGLTMEKASAAGDISGEKIDSAFSGIRMELVAKLKQREMDSDVLANLEKRLMERMEESVRQLKSTMVFKRMSDAGGQPPSRDAILELLKSHSRDDGELKEILTQVRTALVERGVASEEFEKLYDQMLSKPPEKKKEEVKAAAAPGSLNRGSTLFVLEKEILRANRYDTAFSMLSFSIVKAAPQGAVKAGSIATEDVIAAFVTELTQIVRETDLVGMLGAKMIVAIQPMTEAENARLALARITKALKTRRFMVKDVPFDILFAGSVTPYDPERTPDTKAFVRLAQTDLKNIADRLANIQSMM